MARKRGLAGSATESGKFYSTEKAVNTNSTLV